MIELRALGTLVLRDNNGQDLHPVLAQPKRVALLAYLALARPRGFHRRDTLLALLWPEQDEQHARWALNQALRHLRTTLGKDAVPSRGDGEVGIDTRVLSCDAVEFQAAIEADDPVRALDLYRGDLLEGFHVSAGGEFERWLEEERVWLRRQAARAAAALARSEEVRGEAVAAGHWARRAVALAPDDEGELRNLIELLGRVGDRAGAVQAYEEFARRLRVEFEVDPAPETVAAINAVRTRQATVADRPPGTVVPEPEPTVTVPLPGRRWRRWVIPGLLGLAVLGAIALLGVVLRDPEDARDADLLAVAPFEVLEPSLQVWREGMGDVLSRTLDGAGPIRTVSPSVVLRRWSGRADRASAEELGRRTGAGLVVYGAVVARGQDSVTLRAALLDRVGGMGKADIEVSGETSRIGELADSLGIQALRVLSSGRAIASVRRTSIGSRSLPVLKSFLQGEQFYRRGSWDSALTRYDQAIAADSTFALALARMALVLGWHPPTAGAYRPRDEYLRRATLHNHGLPPRDSLLIVADSLYFAAEEMTEPDAWARMRLRSLMAVEEVVRRYPEDPMPWYLLGELRMYDHDSWPIARPPAASLEAFSRAIALDPGFAPPYEHVPQLLLLLGRPEEARLSAATYLALDSTSPNSSSTRLVALVLDSSAAGRAEAARMLDTASITTIWRAFIDHELDSWPDTAEIAVRALRRLGEPGRAAGGDAPWVLDSVMWPQYLAHVLALRGHLHEALAVNERLLRQPSASPWSWFGDRFVDLSPLGVIPDSLARATFGRSLDPGAGWSDLPTPRHLRGLPWWLSRGDTAALAVFGAIAARTAQTSASPHAVMRARLLAEMSGGFLDLARGDSSAAIRKLGAIPDTLCLADGVGDCFHLNLTLARLLAARGDDRRSAALLERWRWSVGSTPLFVIATLELGRIAERLGDTTKAAESYEFVRAIWRRADPELQPYVREARDALARLARTE